ncbi:hypothetical protein GUJ93_ZPchr0001g30174 [Zizania palustris]|uniref:Uncharacterized protein n=1 Tax=Zizania palustris TaxID=103762 RepID=A0A8J5RW76_ZIZPA|nr:hypothetical protein GUJ93_ZPchr0001g30174 [Zizania palustris]
MASIVMLVSELLGRESTGVLAANWYMGGHSLREFRPTAAAAPAPAGVKSERPAEARSSDVDEDKKRKESFEDLAAVSRIAVDVMWP